MSYDEGWGTKARRFLSDTFGFRGSRNITSWLLAGAAAYYLFYLPEQQRVIEIQVRWQSHSRMKLCQCCDFSLQGPQYVWSPAACVPGWQWDPAMHGVVAHGKTP